MHKDPRDPKGLIREAYRIEGITVGECRSIFLDWAMSLPATADSKTAVQVLLTQYADAPQDHPMTQTLRAGLVDIGPARRKGGRRARLDT